MTMVDDRLDIEVEEVTEDKSDEFDKCFFQECDSEADWVLFYSCGHAFSMCDAHRKSVEKAAEFRSLLGPTAREMCHGNPTYIVRKEPAR